MHRVRRCVSAWSVFLMLPLRGALHAGTCAAQAADSLARADSTGAKRAPLVATKVTTPATPIVIDGDLSDAGWQGVPAVSRWFETNVGDNVEPQVANLAYLAYDEEYFYAGFRFEDPNPAGVRAPLGDRDQLSGATDYAGVIVDGNNDGKTAQMSSPTPAACSTTPCRATPRARTTRRTTTGTRWASARRPAGISRSGCRSRRCATSRPRSRPGESRPPATTPTP